MRNTNKKGFTVVELVIVIAVIAILAAVLIPTFAGIIAKANQSADQQAVRNMNTALAAEADKPDNIIEVAAILSDAGFNTEKGLTPLYKGHAFYWFKPTNQIVYVNEAEGKFELIFPKNVEGFPTEKTNDCQSLEVAIAGTVNAPVVSENSTEVGTNIAITSHDAPEGLTTFESVIEWINTLDDRADGKKQHAGNIMCTVNGASKPGIVLANDIKLTEDVIIDIWSNQSTMPINIVGDVTIDLNGYSITQYNYQGAGMALFSVRAGATLNIVDSSAEKDGAIYASYSAFQVDTGATLNLYNGTIGVTPDENRSSYDVEYGYSQHVFVYGGTFNMYGGCLDATAGESSDYYAIGNSYAPMAGTAAVNLYGGEIIGWVDAQNISTFNDYGVSISGDIVK